MLVRWNSQAFKRIIRRRTLKKGETSEEVDEKLLTFVSKGILMQAREVELKMKIE
jgi:hypothetical protein